MFKIEKKNKPKMNFMSIHKWYYNFLELFFHVFKVNFHIMRQASICQNFFHTLSTKLYYKNENLFSKKSTKIILLIPKHG